jgi:hypothetical protein
MVMDQSAVLEGGVAADIRPKELVVESRGRGNLKAEATAINRSVRLIRHGLGFCLMSGLGERFEQIE